MQELLVDDSGRPVDAGLVETVVAERTAHLRNAPVQEFVPVLVENQVRDELRQRGLHANLK